jgi:hypothetical protein
MTDFYVEADLAKTGRSTCRGCKQTIEKGALRIADSYVEDHHHHHHHQSPFWGCRRDSRLFYCRVTWTSDEVLEFGPWRF